VNPRRHLSKFDAARFAKTDHMPPSGTDVAASGENAFADKDAGTSAAPSNVPPKSKQRLQGSAKPSEG